MLHSNNKDLNIFFINRYDVAEEIMVANIVEVINSLTI